MKKAFNKLRRTKQPEQAGRITTDTLAEHRERILAGGRRFKYPVQYQRHKLVFNAIMIGIAAIILLIILFIWQLYGAQNTSDFMYRVTRVIPTPVAVVDGQQVRYSDYLMKYRSSVHYLVEKERLNLSSEDGKRQSDYVKNEAMDDAIADAYAVKLAKDLNISVSDVELEEFLKLQRLSPDGEVSEATYEAVILDYYGWSPDEYREAMKSKLLRQKVAFAVDETAKATSETVSTRIKAGQTDMRALADSLNAEKPGSVTYGSLGWLPKSNQDGGITAAAVNLQKGQVSGAIKSSTGDGYYFVKVIDVNETQVNYEYIQVSLSTLNTDLRNALDSDKRVTIFIDLPEVETTANQQQ